MHYKKSDGEKFANIVTKIDKHDYKNTRGICECLNFLINLDFLKVRM